MTWDMAWNKEAFKKLPTDEQKTYMEEMIGFLTHYVDQFIKEKEEQERKHKPARKLPKESRKEKKSAKVIKKQKPRLRCCVSAPSLIPYKGLELTSKSVTTSTTDITEMIIIIPAGKGHLTNTLLNLVTATPTIDFNGKLEEDTQTNGINEKLEGATNNNGGITEKLDEATNKNGGTNEKLEGATNKNGGTNEKLEGATKKNCGTNDKLDRATNKNGVNEKLDGGTNKNGVNEKLKGATEKLKGPTPESRVKVVELEVNLCGACKRNIQHRLCYSDVKNLWKDWAKSPPDNAVTVNAEQNPRKRAGEYVAPPPKREDRSEDHQQSSLIHKKSSGNLERKSKQFFIGQPAQQSPHVEPVLGHEPTKKFKSLRGEPVRGQEPTKKCIPRDTARMSRPPERHTFEEAKYRLRIRGPNRANYNEGHDTIGVQCSCFSRTSSPCRLHAQEPKRSSGLTSIHSPSSGSPCKGETRSNRAQSPCKAEAQATRGSRFPSPCKVETRGACRCRAARQSRARSPCNIDAICSRYRRAQIPCTVEAQGSCSCRTRSSCNGESVASCLNWSGRPYTCSHCSRSQSPCKGDSQCSLFDGVQSPCNDKPLYSSPYRSRSPCKHEKISSSQNTSKTQRQANRHSMNYYPMESNSSPVRWRY